MAETADQPEFCPLGVDGVLVRFGRFLSDAANAQALAFRDLAARADIHGVVEIASSLTSVRVAFDPQQTDRQSVTCALHQIATQPSDVALKARQRWTIPVSFTDTDAPQLAEAAALAGVTTEQAVKQITETEVRVLALGFAPGQPYLGMLPSHWDIPRQDSLTSRLPRGALVAAVRQLIIFVADAPTGWRHIGQTAFEVYRPDAPDPFAFAPGDVVRFAVASGHEIAASRATGDPNGGAICDVLR